MKKYGLFFGLLVGALLLASTAVAATVGKPSGISAPATDSDGQFNVTFGASSTAGVTYELYENDIKIYSNTARKFLVNGRTAGTYAYKVHAIKDGMDPSPFTTRVTTEVSGNGLPQVVAPSGITATANDIDGVFSVNVGASTTADALYTFEEKIDDGAWGGVQTASTSRRYNATGKLSGKKYSYRAFASKVGMADSAPTAITTTFVASSAYCSSCHPATATIWAANRHGNSNAQPAVSYTNSCGQCHSPTTELNAGEFMAVTCLGCHRYNGTDANGHPAVNQDAAIASCAKCHNSHMSADNSIATKVSASAHGANSCAVCHDPHSLAEVTSANCTASCHAAAGTPGIAHSGSLQTCTNCHDAHSLSLSAGASAAYHAAVSNTASNAFCGTCHTNAPHYGGTAFHKAQYVSDASLPVSCSSCHGNPVNTSGNAAILVQFAGSAHGNPAGEAWRHFDWRSASRASCARCHAGTAFVAKLDNENSSANVYQTTDVLKAGEVLNCSACHTDAGTGALRRTSEAFTINITNGTVSYDVDGASTLCARCHSGRETGDSIKNDPSTTGVRGFIASHYLAAAGTLFNLGGYEYDTTYNTLGAHKGIGTGTDEEGPCVTCHMPGKSHTFVAGSSPVCTSCHADTAAATLAAAKASYDTTLNTLKLALEAKGIYYASTHPNFFTTAYVDGGVNAPVTNWAVPYGDGSWKHTMGAAFNYNLLLNEPGAYVHNYDYAMKLIDDSIDFLNDGLLNDNGL